MKFGKHLESKMTQEWRDKYLQFDTLCQLLSALEPSSARQTKLLAQRSFALLNLTHPVRLAGAQLPQSTPKDAKPITNPSKSSQNDISSTTLTLAPSEPTFFTDQSTTYTSAPSQSATSESLYGHINFSNRSFDSAFDSFSSSESPDTAGNSSETASDGDSSVCTTQTTTTLNTQLNKSSKISQNPNDLTGKLPKINNTSNTGGMTIHTSQNEQSTEDLQLYLFSPNIPTFQPSTSAKSLSYSPHLSPNFHSPSFDENNLIANENGHDMLTFSNAPHLHDTSDFPNANTVSSITAENTRLNQLHSDTPHRITPQQAHLFQQIHVAGGLHDGNKHDFDPKLSSITALSRITPNYQETQPYVPPPDSYPNTPSIHDYAHRNSISLASNASLISQQQQERQHYIESNPNPHSTSDHNMNPLPINRKVSVSSIQPSTSFLSSHNLANQCVGPNDESDQSLHHNPQNQQNVNNIQQNDSKDSYQPSYAQSLSQNNAFPSKIGPLSIDPTLAPTPGQQQLLNERRQRTGIEHTLNSMNQIESFGKELRAQKDFERMRRRMGANTPRGGLGATTPRLRRGTTFNYAESSQNQQNLLPNQSNSQNQRNDFQREDSIHSIYSTITTGSSDDSSDPKNLHSQKPTHRSKLLSAHSNLSAIAPKATQRFQSIPRNNNSNSNTSLYIPTDQTRSEITSNTPKYSLSSLQQINALDRQVQYHTTQPLTPSTASKNPRSPIYQSVSLSTDNAPTVSIHASNSSGNSSVQSISPQKTYKSQHSPKRKNTKYSNRSGVTITTAPLNKHGGSNNNSDPDSDEERFIRFNTQIDKSDEIDMNQAAHSVPGSGKQPLRSVLATSRRNQDKDDYEEKHPRFANDVIVIGYSRDYEEEEDDDSYHTSNCSSGEDDLNVENNDKSDKSSKGRGNDKSPKKRSSEDNNDGSVKFATYTSPKMRNNGQESPRCSKKSLVDDSTDDDPLISTSYANKRKSTHGSTGKTIHPFAHNTKQNLQKRLSQLLQGLNDDDDEPTPTDGNSPPCVSEIDADQSFSQEKINTSKSQDIRQDKRFSRDNRSSGYDSDTETLSYGSSTFSRSSRGNRFSQSQFSVSQETSNTVENTENDSDDSDNDYSLTPRGLRRRSPSPSQVRYTAYLRNNSMSRDASQLSAIYLQHIPQTLFDKSRDLDPNGPSSHGNNRNTPQFSQDGPALVKNQSNINYPHITCNNNLNLFFPSDPPHSPITTQNTTANGASQIYRIDSTHMQPCGECNIPVIFSDLNDLSPHTPQIEDSGRSPTPISPTTQNTEANRGTSRLVKPLYHQPSEPQTKQPTETSLSKAPNILKKAWAIRHKLNQQYNHNQSCDDYALDYSKNVEKCDEYSHHSEHDGDDDSQVLLKNKKYSDSTHAENPGILPKYSTRRIAGVEIPPIHRKCNYNDDLTQLDPMYNFTEGTNNGYTVDPAITAKLKKAKKDLKKKSQFSIFKRLFSNTNKPLFETDLTHDDDYYYHKLLLKIQSYNTTPPLQRDKSFYEALREQCLMLRTQGKYHLLPNVTFTEPIDILNELYPFELRDPVEVEEEIENIPPFPSFIPENSVKFGIESLFCSGVQSQLEKVNEFTLLLEEYYDAHLFNIATVISQLEYAQTVVTKSCIDNLSVDLDMYIHYRDKQIDKIKKTLKEIYRGIHFLEEYQQINLLGFAKILKKHDKRSQSFPYSRDLFLPIIFSTHFAQSTAGDTMKYYTEQLFSHVFGYKETSRILHKQDSHITDNNLLRVGFFVGIVSVLVLANILLFILYPLQSFGSDSFQVGFPIFRVLAYIVFIMWCWGVVTYFCDKQRINWQLVMQLNPHNYLKPMQTFEISAFLTVVWLITFTMFVFSASYDVQSPMQRYTIFFSLILFLVLLFNPFNFMYRQSRYYVILRSIRFFCAPFTPATIQEAIAGNWWSSANRMLFDITYIGCFYGHFPVTQSTSINEFDFCNKQTSDYAWWIRLVPPVSRMLQNIRSAYYTREWYPFAVNAMKYTVAFPDIIGGYLLKITDYNTVVLTIWVLSALFRALWSWIWDISMDWQLPTRMQIVSDRYEQLLAQIELQKQEALRVGYVYDIPLHNNSKDKGLLFSPEQSEESDTELGNTSGPTQRKYMNPNTSTTAIQAPGDIKDNTIEIDTYLARHDNLINFVPQYPRRRFICCGPYDDRNIDDYYNQSYPKWALKTWFLFYTLLIVPIKYILSCIYYPLVYCFACCGFIFTLSPCKSAINHIKYSHCCTSHANQNAHISPDDDYINIIMSECAKNRSPGQESNATNSNSASPANSTIELAQTSSGDHAPDSSTNGIPHTVTVPVQVPSVSRAYWKSHLPPKGYSFKLIPNFPAWHLPHELLSIHFHHGMWFYFLCIVIDLVLRCTFFFSVQADLSLRLFGIKNDWLLFVLGLLELARRAMWLYLRFENEHLKATNKLQALSLEGEIVGHERGIWRSREKREEEQQQAKDEHQQQQLLDTQPSQLQPDLFTSIIHSQSSHPDHLRISTADPHSVSRHGLASVPSISNLPPLNTRQRSISVGSNVHSLTTSGTDDNEEILINMPRDQSTYLRQTQNLSIFPSVQAAESLTRMVSSLRIQIDGKEGSNTSESRHGDPHSVERSLSSYRPTATPMEDTVSPVFEPSINRENSNFYKQGESLLRDNSRLNPRRLILTSHVPPSSSLHAIELARTPSAAMMSPSPFSPGHGHRRAPSNANINAMSNQPQPQNAQINQNIYTTVLDSKTQSMASSASLSTDTDPDILQVIVSKSNNVPPTHQNHKSNDYPATKSFSSSASSATSGTDGEYEVDRYSFTNDQSSSSLYSIYPQDSTKSPPLPQPPTLQKTLGLRKHANSSNMLSSLDKTSESTSKSDQNDQNPTWPSDSNTENKKSIISPFPTSASTIGASSQPQAKKQLKPSSTELKHQQSTTAAPFSQKSQNIDKKPQPQPQHHTILEPIMHSDKDAPSPLPKTPTQDHPTSPSITPQIIQMPSVSSPFHALRSPQSFTDLTSSQNSDGIESDMNINTAPTVHVPHIAPVLMNLPLLPPPSALKLFSVDTDLYDQDMLYENVSDSSTTHGEHNSSD